MFTSATLSADLVIAITETQPPRIQVADAATGGVVGSVQVGAYPMPLLRSSRQELLVSERYRAEPAGVNHRLLILDLAHDLKLKVALPLPNRPDYTAFAPGMALSADQRFLYYLKQLIVETHPDAAYDDCRIGVIDLDSGAEVASVPLPVNSGFSLLCPLDASNMMVMSPEFACVYAANVNGVATLIAQFERHVLEDVGGKGYRAWPIYAGITQALEPYMIFEDGWTRRLDQAGHIAAEHNILPLPGFRMSGLLRWRVDAEFVVLGFRSQFGSSLTGAILVDARDPSTASLVALPQGTASLAALGGRRIVALHDQRLSIVDLSSRVVATGPQELPFSAQWIVGH